MESVKEVANKSTTGTVFLATTSKTTPSGKQNFDNVLISGNVLDLYGFG